MRQFSCAALALVLWATAAPAQEPAALPAGEPARWVARLGDADGTLNIRAEPSAEAPIVIGVADGTVLRNLGCRENDGRRWCEVATEPEAEGERSVGGWAAAEFLEEADTAVPEAAVAPADAAPAETAPAEVAPADSEPAVDVLVPGTPFDDMGLVECAHRAGVPADICEYGVVRVGAGSGAVTVFWPSGGSRVIRFENGTPSGFDRRDTDGDAELRALRDGDRTVVEIGEERITIPDTVLSGG